MNQKQNRKAWKRAQMNALCRLTAAVAAEAPSINTINLRLLECDCVGAVPAEDVTARIKEILNPKPKAEPKPAPRAKVWKVVDRPVTKDDCKSIVRAIINNSFRRRSR